MNYIQNRYQQKLCETYDIDTLFRNYLKYINTSW